MVMPQSTYICNTASVRNIFHCGTYIKTPTNAWLGLCVSATSTSDNQKAGGGHGEKKHKHPHDEPFAIDNLDDWRFKFERDSDALKTVVEGRQLGQFGLDIRRPPVRWLCSSCYCIFSLFTTVKTVAVEGQRTFSPVMIRCYNFHGISSYNALDPLATLTLYVYLSMPYLYTHSATVVALCV